MASAYVILSDQTLTIQDWIGHVEAIHKWCIDNCRYGSWHWYRLYDIKIRFDDPEDATALKLTFGIK
jgi:hypothetical protein